LADISGASRSLQSFGRHLAGSEFEPWVILPSGGPLAEALSADGIRCAVLRKDPYKQADSPQGRRFQYTPWFAARVLLYRLRYIVRLALWLRRNAVRAAWINSLANSSGTIAARLAGVPYVWQIHEGDGFRERRLASLRTPALRGAPRLVAVSESSRAYLLSLGVSPDRIETIHGGIDVRAFRPDRAAREEGRRELAIGPDVRLVGSTHLIMPEKGTRELMLAAGRLANKHPNTSFVVVGDTRSDETARGYFREIDGLRIQLGLGDRWRFVGPRLDVRPLVAAMDVFVLASTYESFGLSILEAMSLGKPVVATDCGGPREIVVNGETGFLVPTGDIAALADAIVRLVEDPILAEALGRNSRRRVLDQFRIERAMARQAEVLRDVIGGARRERR
jgi:glycosyltransferase involved in cell wall biosynthesis